MFSRFKGKPKAPPAPPPQQAQPDATPFSGPSAAAGEQQGPGPSGDSQYGRSGVLPPQQVIGGPAPTGSGRQPAGSAPSASLQGQPPAGSAAAAPQGSGPSRVGPRVSQSAPPAAGPEAAAAAAAVETGSAAGKPLPQEKRPPKKAGGIRSELATPDAKIQSPALMAVLNRIAVGADMSELVSVVCRHVVARPAPVLSKQLAYDIVKSGAPGDADWEFVYAGIRFDLGPGSPPAVAAAALAALQGLPPHRFAEALAASGADTGEWPVQRSDSAASGRGGAAGLPAHPQPLVRDSLQPQTSAPSLAAAAPQSSFNASASGAAANLAAMDAAIRGSGPSASAAKPEASRPSEARGQGGLEAERSYSTAAGMTFDGSGVTGSAASASGRAPAHSEQSITAGSRVALRVRLGEALASESPAVRAAAVEALGRAVASPVVLAAIAASSTPGNVDLAVAWAERLGDSLLDGSPGVAAAGAAAVAGLLTAAAGLAPDGTVAPGARAVLPPEAAAAMSAEPGAGSWVTGRAAAKLAWRATAGLSSVLRRAHTLAPLDQVHVIRMLVALLEYSAARDFSLPPPALDNPLANWSPPPKAQEELLPSLDPIAELSATNTAVASGGELAGPWMIEVAGLYIAELLESPAAALQFEAARALLRLSSLAQRVAQSGHVASPVAAASRWAPTAVTTILELWDRQPGTGGRAEIVAAVAGHLAALPAGAQPPLARQLVPLIAKLPFAAERAGAFAKVWAAMLALDLQQRRAVRSGAPLLPNADLKALLADPFVMHIAGATSSASDAAAKATYPAFRDEMVMTLLGVADAHPWGARTQELLAGPDPASVAMLPRSAAFGPSTAADKKRGAAQREAARFAAEAAYRQRTAETLDWLGSARIALQGSKACLGWERAPDGGLHACTAVVDAWLRLLQRALHAVRALRAAVPAAPEHAAPGAASAADRGDLTLEEVVATADGGPAAKIGLLLADHEKTLQDLVSQIVTHWKALSPAVAPRALWVAAHHAALPRRLPGAWANMLDWIDALLQRGLTDESSKVFAAKQAVAEGSLSARNAFASAADRRADGPESPRPDIIVNEDGEAVEETKEDGPKEGGLEGPQAAADDAGIAVEGLDAAAAALERLTALLLFNSQGDAFAWSLKELAGRMLEVVQYYIDDPRARIDARERLGRAARRIRSVASRTDAKPPKSDKEKAKEKERRAKARAEAAKAAEEAAKAAMPEEVTEASDFNAALAAAGVQPPAENGTAAPTANGVSPADPAAAGADEDDELDEDEILAMMRMVPDPDAAQVEGFPFGPPPSAVLAGTRRTARYLALDSVVGAATAEAYGDTSAQQKKPSTQTEVAGLPSLVEVMELVSGQVGGPDSSATLELTGPADPLRLTARHDLDLVTRTLALSFVLYNRLPGEVAGAFVRLASGGPLTRPAPGPVVFRLPPLPGRGQHAFRATFRLAGFGRLVVQPFVGVPLRGFSAAEAPLLRAKPYTVSPVALLQAPREAVSAAGFFQAWPPVPYTADVTALGAAAGVDGGLLALSALERSPLARVLLQGLPALGGFQAAYLGNSLGDATVALVVTGQLLPFEEAAPATLNPGELDAAHKQLATDPVLSAAFGLSPAAPEAAPQPPRRTVSVAGSRVAVRLTVRSTSAEIVAAIEADKPAFVQDLFDGALVAGSVSDAVASGFRGPLRLTPAVSALKWAYQAMGISMPPGEGAANDAEDAGSTAEAEDADEDKPDELAAIAAGEDVVAPPSEASGGGTELSSSADGSVIEREGYEGETSSESGASSGDGKEEAEEVPPPLAAPDLFDAVAEEWQRLRLAMQDVY